MSTMESVILVASLAAAAGGSIVLLCCLAGKRAGLIQVFNLEQEQLARQRALEAQRAADEKQKTRPEPIPHHQPA